ncbi:MAG: restriction endonuclease [Clostridia bacterium]|nr:restriction endonuclease [Clostridia bacterium]
MTRTASHTKIYRTIVDVLEDTPLEREHLIEKVLSRIGLTSEQLTDRSLGSAQSNLRARVGSVINELHAAHLIAIDDMGKYYLITARPVVIRIERCEREIIKALSEGEMTKSALRDRLKYIFGTAKTVTTRDDDTLSTYMGEILKKLRSLGVINIENGVYSLAPHIRAKADDINATLTVKSDYIRRVHQKGGEFFENYFMQLLKKYMIKHGRTVLECYVAGGADDGGIDGVIKTEDSLGFRETTMVQTKNRIDIVSETDVRGFYGAVCAKRGTRGIFVTTSDFHRSAKEFLDALDDCVAINGDTLFRMAIECSHGIKKVDGYIEIDSKIL